MTPTIRRRMPPAQTKIPILKAIFQHCQDTGVTTYDLADRIGSNQTTVSHYRTGRHMPSILVVVEMCAALGLEIVIRPSNGSASK